MVNHLLARIMKNVSSVLVFITLLILTNLIGCASNEQPAQVTIGDSKVSADKLLPVDCLLPPQVRKLGSQTSYLAARKAIKTTALDCEIRGGEYVAYDRADYRTALNAWLDKANAGDAEAQTYVGEIYEKGMGLAPDYKVAFMWYSKAAEQGYSRAQLNLGYLYEKGLGIDADAVKALNYYRMAAGVNENEIDYASTIDLKAAALAEEQTLLLKEEIDRREFEILKLQSMLADTEYKLNSRNKALQDSKQKLEQLKKEMQNAKPDTTGMQDLQRQYDEQQAKIKTAQRQYDELLGAISSTKSRMELQRKSVQQQKQQLTSKKLPGPIIELHDPFLLVTRSGDPVVRVRAGSKAQVISGRIIAAAGLDRATINERALNPDSAGYFHSAVSVSSGITRVQIEAVDRLGQQADLNFNIQTTPEATQQARTAADIGRVANAIEFGNYYALVIGNNEYKQFPTLQTAINDAQRVAEVLRTKYGFKTRLITNADRYTILSALNEIKGKITENDNLLIYYAGHGERDPSTLQGYWLPVDAEQENTANWIPNSAISDLINTFSARHVMIVADSCYSGSMTRSAMPRLDTQLSDQHLEKWLKVMSKTLSRTVLTSGSIEPVLDSGGGKHSIFAKAFIAELEGSSSVIDAYRIYRNVSAEVRKAASELGFHQTPTYAPIQHAGHAGGEFIFVGS